MKIIDVKVRKSCILILQHSRSCLSNAHLPQPDILHHHLPPRSLASLQLKMTYYNNYNRIILITNNLSKSTVDPNLSHYHDRSFSASSSSFELFVRSGGWLERRGRERPEDSHDEAIKNQTKTNLDSDSRQLHIHDRFVRRTQSILLIYGVIVGWDCLK